MPSSLGPQFQSKLRTAPSSAVIGPKSGPDSFHESDDGDLSCIAPGPGSYTNSIRSLSSCGVRFGRSTRPKALFPSEPESSPGAMYASDSQLTRPQSRVFPFARAPRSTSIRSSPRLGPGTYDPPSSSLSKKSSSFGLSHEAYRHVFYPGCDRERLGRTSMSTGSIPPSTFREDGVSFPRSARSLSSATLSQLGPGHYEPCLLRRRDTSSWFGPPSRRCRLSFSRIAQLKSSFWV